MSAGAALPQDEKQTGTTSLAKTFRTLRKRLSRTSNSTKHERLVTQVKSQAIEKDNAAKSGGDESEASSVGDEPSQLVFSEIPTSNPDLTAVTSPTGAPPTLKGNRSVPTEATPTIVTSPPPLDSSEPVDKAEDSTSSAENSGLSKTWSTSAFTGAQLRGTCSLEYTEHMREKSHKRKAHVVDLRKDDAQCQQLTPPSMTTTSNPSTSTSFTRCRSHTLTVIPTKGARLLTFLFIYLTRTDSCVEWGHVVCVDRVLSFSLSLHCARYSWTNDLMKTNNSSFVCSSSSSSSSWCSTLLRSI